MKQIITTHTIYKHTWQFCHENSTESNAENDENKNNDN